MKLEPFLYNLNNRIIPIATNSMITEGFHPPTIFTYKECGTESVGDLRKVFSFRGKKIIYNVLKSFLSDSDARAFVLINEAWNVNIKKEDENNEEHKALLEGRKRVRDINRKKECITFQWVFKSRSVTSGIVMFPLKREDGNVMIEYENSIEKRDDENTMSRIKHLLS